VQVTDALLTEVALNCPLRTLSVRNCSAVTDRGMRAIAAGAPQLTALIADDVRPITDDALVALSESCRDLQVWWTTVPTLYMSQHRQRL
jgi:hypothetical protein